MESVFSGFAATGAETFEHKHKHRQALLVSDRLSVTEFQAQWADLVLQVVWPTLQRLAGEITVARHNPATASDMRGVWILQVPGGGNLCVTSEAGTQKILIYETHSDRGSTNRHYYAPAEVTEALLRERAGECFGQNGLK